MSLNESAFIVGTHSVREIEFPDGVARPLNFKHLSHAEWELFRVSSQSTDEITASQATTKLIMISIVENDGKTPVIPLEKALRLEDEFGKRIVREILIVNGRTAIAQKKLTAAAKKKSRNATARPGSGSSSR